MAEMKEEPETLLRAQARSDAARAQLAQTLVELQSRLTPKALARDALQEIRETGEELAREGVAAARRHPLGIASALAALVLYTVRRPLRALLPGGGPAPSDTPPAPTQGSEP